MTDLVDNLKTLRVYRVQNSLGDGMYRASISSMMLEDVRHPEPYRDSALMDEMEVAGFCRGIPDCYFYYGFASIEQLKSWIYEEQWRWILDGSGYQVTVWEGPAAHGDTQAVFVKSASEMLGVIPWDDLRAEALIPTTDYH